MWLIATDEHFIVRMYSVTSSRKDREVKLKEESKVLEGKICFEEAESVTSYVVDSATKTNMKVTAVVSAIWKSHSLKYRSKSLGPLFWDIGNKTNFTSGLAFEKLAL